MIPQNDYNEKDFEILRKKVGVDDSIIESITDSVTQTVINNIENTLIQNIKNEVVQEISGDFTTPPKIRWATNALFNNAVLGTGSNNLYDSTGSSNVINTTQGTTVDNLEPITMPAGSYAHIALINYAPPYEKNGKAVKFSPVNVKYPYPGIDVTYAGNGKILVFNHSGREHSFVLKSCVMEGIMYDFSNSNELDPESSWTFGGDA